ncbi:MAG: sugar-binding protein [Planctomycetia bacterium]|nr:sugar-binding protein [Planctomycetia bacterium]
MKFAMSCACALVVLFAVSSCDKAQPGEAEAPKDLTFVVIGDTRPPGGGDGLTQPPAFIKNIEGINLLEPAFVVNVGDLILGYNADENLDFTLKQWDEFDKAAGKINMPLRLVAGNHDIWNPKSQEVYEKRYGKPYYSFDSQGCHFVVLCTEMAKENQVSKIAGQQLEWLKKDLAEKAIPDRTFVFLHKPLWQNVHVQQGAAQGWMKDVHPLMKQYKVKAVFAGHVHIYSFDEIDGIRYVITGGGGAEIGNNPLVGDFHHFVLVSVRPEEVTLAVIPTGSIKPPTVVTAEFRRKFKGMSASASMKTLVIGKDSLENVPASFEIENILEEPLKVEIRWAIDANTNWVVSDKSLSTTIEPGKSGRLEFTLSCLSKAVTPSPQYSVYFYIGDGEALKVGGGSLPLAKSIRLSTLPQGLAIDGKLDEWKGPEAGAMAQRGFIVTGAETWKGPEDCSARFWLAKDAEAIYLAVEVTDNAVYPNPNLAQVWGGDAVEVFFDFRAADKLGQSRHTAGVVQFGFAPAKGDGDVALWTAAPKIEGFVGKSARTATGYTMELKFPRAGLKKAGLVPGKTFNFDIAVDDGDKSEPVSRKSQMVWSSSWDAWENASRYSRVLPAR